MKVRELFEGKIDMLDIDVENGHFKDEVKNSIINGDFNCNGLYELTSLENSPERITGDMYIHNCSQLADIKNAPRIVTGKVMFTRCRSILSLEGIGRDYFTLIGRKMWIPINVKSNMLGILKINNLLEIGPDTFEGDLGQAIKIINKYLKSGRNLRKCKSELEEAGLQGFAKL